MMSVKPAEIRSETPTLPGVVFGEAARLHLCVWPISGAGEQMVVCGQPRAPGWSYCKACYARAHPPSAQDHRRIRAP